jgi:hypothetical protein
MYVVEVCNRFHMQEEDINSIYVILLDYFLVI